MSLTFQQRILAVKAKVLLPYIYCVTGMGYRIYLELRCRGLYRNDTNRINRFSDFAVSKFPQMLQEKWIKIILTHRYIYVFLFIFIFVCIIAYSHILIIWHSVLLKILLPLYICVTKILKISVVNLSVKSLALCEIWDFSRRWDVTLCSPVDTY